MQIVTDAMLTSARRAQASIMTARCIIRDPETRWAWDEETQSEVEVLGEVVYSGPCRWQAKQVGTQTVPAGGQPIPVDQFVGAIPWDAPTIKPGMTLEITEADDPELLGMYTLNRAEASSFATARRLHGERP